VNRFGYWNRILHVDLGERRTWVESPGCLVRKLGGGRSLIATTPHRDASGVDPFSPGTSWCSPRASSPAHPCRAGDTLWEQVALNGDTAKRKRRLLGRRTETAGWTASSCMAPRTHRVPLDQRRRRRDPRRIQSLGQAHREVEDLIRENSGAACPHRPVRSAGERLVRFAWSATTSTRCRPHRHGAVMGAKKLRRLRARTRPVPSPISRP